MRTKGSILVFAACLLALPAVATASPTVEWVSSADGRWNDRDINWSLGVHEATGMVFASGESWGYDPVQDDYAIDFLTAAFHADGEVAWVRPWGTVDWPWAFGIAMAVDQRNGVVATSGDVWPREPVAGDANNDYLAVGYDLAGNTLFEARYRPASARSPGQKGLVHNRISGAFLGGVAEPGVCGVQFWPDGSTDSFVLPLTSDWTYTEAIATNEITGLSYVAGAFWSGGAQSYFVASYDTAGTLRWLATRPSDGYARLRGMAHASSTDTTYVLLLEYTIYGDGYRVLAYDDSGSELWSSGPLAVTRPSHAPIAHDPANGQVLVAGNADQQLVVQALDAVDGTVRWSRFHGDPNGWNGAWDLTVDASGSSYVVGSIRPAGATYVTSTLLSYDAAGSTRFVESLETPDLRWAGDRLHVDGLFNIYVGGAGCFGDCPNGSDLVAMKLSQIPSVDAIASKVQELVAAGVLGQGEGRALLAQLNAAAASMDRGDTAAATGQLTAFIESAEALLLSERLTPEQAGALIDAGRALRDSL